MRAEGNLLVCTGNASERHETGYMWHEYFTCVYVQMDLLTTLETKTHCPFKGEMIFYSLGDK
ncbi:hypothetical protein DQ400_12065 [Vreelandella sulfidaeris]|uniref:DUF427 domain-containing protein n=1 Tax=Vreelandella sulfidaeris TaxID=115553 RepID=A0A365TPU4_9GAMM|nr:hypothetical protein DQ400_12065 [Halomonas sulfidaeris]